MGKGRRRRRGNSLVDDRDTVKDELRHHGVVRQLWVDGCVPPSRQVVVLNKVAQKVRFLRSLSPIPSCPLHSA
jgi:uncharacterized protein with von Willebrand factor type A (vWA) domain